MGLENVDMLLEDIERNQERYDECAEAGDRINAAIYAGKELEARRILTKIRIAQIYK